MPKRITLKAMFVALTLIACALSLISWQQVSTRRGRQLEATIAQMPTEITVAEAHRLLGSQPDSIDQQSGVMMSAVTMLTANNSKSSDYGISKDYALHNWKRGNVNATVVVNKDGRVDGRWTW